MLHRSAPPLAHPRGNSARCARCGRLAGSCCRDPTAILDEVGVATRERGREQRAVRVGGRLALGPDDGDGWLIRPNRLRSLDTQHGLLADRTPLPHRAAHNRSYLIPAARMSAAGTP